MELINRNVNIEYKYIILKIILKSTKYSQHRSDNLQVLKHVGVAVVAVDHTVQAFVIFDPFLLSGWRWAAIQVFRDLTICQRVFQFEAVQELPDCRVAVVN